MKLEEFKYLNRNNATIDTALFISLQDNYSYSLNSFINIYEFACQQYLANKIDREAFKLFYFDLIKYIRKEYSDYIDNRDRYTAIKRVHKEWHGE